MLFRSHSRLWITLLLIIVSAGMVAGWTAHAIDPEVRVPGDPRGPYRGPVAGAGQQTQSKEDIGTIQSLFQQGIMGVFWLYMNIVAIALAFLGRVLDYVINVSRFAGNPWVLAGWRTMRDFLNILFIPALLTIAYATIAGIERYDMRRLLPRLIMAALLVNFSLAIGGAAVSASRIAMSELAGDSIRPGSAISEKLAKVSLVKDFFNFKPEVIWNAAVSGNPAEGNWDIAKTTGFVKFFVGIVIAAVMLTIVTVALGAVTLMLVIRVIVLYVLLILSPVGFVTSILPRTQKYAEKWWDMFINHLVYGPIMVFFLTVAARIGVREDGAGAAQFSTLSAQLGIEGTNPAAKFFLEGTGGALFGSMFEALFVTLFLIMALYIATEAGAFGASIGTAVGRGWIPGIARAPFRVAGAGAGYAAGVTGRAAQEYVGKPVGRQLRGAPGIRQTLDYFQGPSRLGAVLTGTKVSEQVEEQKKYLGSRSRDEILRRASTGDRAAMELAAEKGYFDKSEQYERALAAIPANSSAHGSVRKAYEERFPTRAILGSQLRNDLATGKASTDQVSDDQRTKLGKAMQKMKPEDYLKLEPEDLQAAAAAGLRIPFTTAHLDAIFNSNRDDLQDKAQELLGILERAKTAGQTSVAQDALLKFAKDKRGYI